MLERYTISFIRIIFSIRTNKVRLGLRYCNKHRNIRFRTCVWSENVWIQRDFSKLHNFTVQSPDVEARCMPLRKPPNFVRTPQHNSSVRWLEWNEMKSNLQNSRSVDWLWMKVEAGHPILVTFPGHDKITGWQSPHPPGWIIGSSDNDGLLRMDYDTAKNCNRRNHLHWLCSTALY